MPTFTVNIIAAGNASLDAGEFDSTTFTVTDATISTLSIDDDDTNFEGDAASGTNESGDDSNQFLAGTTDLVYLERGYTITDGTDTWTVYIVESGGTVVGWALEDGSPPLPTGTFTITGNFNVDNAGIVPDYTDLETPCLVRGTLIDTARGMVAVEDLCEGDQVRTLDNGMQAIRWVGSVSVAAKGSMAPVVIRKGAMGNTRDLSVSPKHRMMLQGWQLEQLFDTNDVLATAESLINDSTITRKEGGMVEYFHVMFDAHQIIFAEGAPTESFHPGMGGIDTVANASREEIYTLFPQLRDAVEEYGPSVRRPLNAGEIEMLPADVRPS